MHSSHSYLSACSMSDYFCLFSSSLNLFSAVLCLTFILFVHCVSEFLFKIGIFLFMISLFHTHHFLSMYFLLLCNKLPKLTSLKTTHLLSQHLWTRSPAWFSWTLFQVLKGYDQRIRQAAFPSGYWGKNMIPSLFRLGYYAFAHSTILTISFVIMRKLFYILACV